MSRSNRNVKNAERFSFNPRLYESTSSLSTLNFYEEEGVEVERRTRQNEKAMMRRERKETTYDKRRSVERQGKSRHTDESINSMYGNAVRERNCSNSNSCEYVKFGKKRKLKIRMMDASQSINPQKNDNCTECSVGENKENSNFLRKVHSRYLDLERKPHLLYPGETSRTSASLQKIDKLNTKIIDQNSEFNTESFTAKLNPTNVIKQKRTNRLNSISNVTTGKQDNIFLQNEQNKIQFIHDEAPALSKKRKEMPLEINHKKPPKLRVIRKIEEDVNKRNQDYFNDSSSNTSLQDCTTAKTVEKNKNLKKSGIMKENLNFSYLTNDFKKTTKVEAFNENLKKEINTKAPFILQPHVSTHPYRAKCKELQTRIPHSYEQNMKERAVFEENNKKDERNNQSLEMKRRSQSKRILINEKVKIDLHVKTNNKELNLNKKENYYNSDFIVNSEKLQDVKARRKSLQCMRKANSYKRQKEEEEEEEEDEEKEEEEEDEEKEEEEEEKEKEEEEEEEKEEIKKYKEKPDKRVQIPDFLSKKSDLKNKIKSTKKSQRNANVYYSSALPGFSHDVEEKYGFEELRGDCALSVIPKKHNKLKMSDEANNENEIIEERRESLDSDKHNCRYNTYTKKADNNNYKINSSGKIKRLCFLNNNTTTQDAKTSYSGNSFKKKSFENDSNKFFLQEEKEYLTNNSKLIKGSAIFENSLTESKKNHKLTEKLLKESMNGSLDSSTKNVLSSAIDIYQGKSDKHRILQRNMNIRNKKTEDVKNSFSCLCDKKEGKNSKEIAKNLDDKVSENNEKNVYDLLLLRKDSCATHLSSHASCSPFLPCCAKDDDVISTASYDKYHNCVQRKNKKRNENFAAFLPSASLNFPKETIIVDVDANVTAPSCRATPVAASFSLESEKKKKNLFFSENKEALANVSYSKSNSNRGEYDTVKKSSDFDNNISKDFERKNMKKTFIFVNNSNDNNNINEADQDEKKSILITEGVRHITIQHSPRIFLSKNANQKYVIINEKKKKKIKEENYCGKIKEVKKKKKNNNSDKNQAISSSNDCVDESCLCGKSIRKKQEKEDEEQEKEDEEQEKEDEEQEKEDEEQEKEDEEQEKEDEEQEKEDEEQEKEDEEQEVLKENTLCVTPKLRKKQRIYHCEEEDRTSSCDEVSKKHHTNICVRTMTPNTLMLCSFSTHTPYVQNVLMRHENHSNFARDSEDLGVNREKDAASGGGYFRESNAFSPHSEDFPDRAVARKVRKKHTKAVTALADKNYSCSFNTLEEGISCEAEKLNRPFSNEKHLSKRNDAYAHDANCNSANCRSPEDRTFQTNDSNSSQKELNFHSNTQRKECLRAVSTTYSTETNCMSFSSAQPHHKLKSFNLHFPHPNLNQPSFLSPAVETNASMKELNGSICSSLCCINTDCVENENSKAGFAKKKEINITPSIMRKNSMKRTRANSLPLSVTFSLPCSSHSDDVSSSFTSSVVSNSSSKNLTSKEINLCEKVDKTLNVRCSSSLKFEESSLRSVASNEFPEETKHATSLVACSLSSESSNLTDNSVCNSHETHSNLRRKSNDEYNTIIDKAESKFKKKDKNKLSLLSILSPSQLFSLIQKRDYGFSYLNVVHNIAKKHGFPSFPSILKLNYNNISIPQIPQFSIQWYFIVTQLAREFNNSALEHFRSFVSKDNFTEKKMLMIEKLLKLVLCRFFRMLRVDCFDKNKITNKFNFHEIKKLKDDDEMNKLLNAIQMFKEIEKHNRICRVWNKHIINCVKLESAWHNAELICQRYNIDSNNIKHSINEQLALNNIVDTSSAIVYDSSPDATPNRTLCSEQTEAKNVFRRKSHNLSIEDIKEYVQNVEISLDDVESLELQRKELEWEYRKQYRKLQRKVSDSIYRIQVISEALNIFRLKNKHFQRLIAAVVIESGGKNLETNANSIIESSQCAFPQFKTLLKVNKKETSPSSCNSLNNLIIPVSSAFSSRRYSLNSLLGSMAEECTTDIQQAVFPLSQMYGYERQKNYVAEHDNKSKQKDRSTSQKLSFCNDPSFIAKRSTPAAKGKNISSISKLRLKLHEAEALKNAQSCSDKYNKENEKLEEGEEDYDDADDEDDFITPIPTFKTDNSLNARSIMDSLELY